MKNKKKVAIIAIAKNESLYFADWIAHHLFFGFEEFVIGVNRTEDSSVEVLKEISKYVNLKYEDLDWIDRTEIGGSARIQSISYAYLQTKLSQDITDDIFLDIDEFWFPLDFKTKIGQLIASFDYTFLSFNWFCLGGEVEKFSPPFTFINGSVNPHVKTIFNLKKIDDIEIFRCHTPLVKNNVDFVHITPDGSGHIPKGGEISTNLNPQKYYILHRMCRSEVEYLALLLRSRPNKDCRLKSNRNGFFISDKKQLEFSPSGKYFSYLSKFRVKLSLKSLIDIEKERKHSLSSSILDVDIEDICKDIDIYLKVLKGTNKLNELCYMILSSVKSADILRDLSIKLEKIDLNLSYLLMSRALELRPNGSVIKRKLAVYSQQLGIIC